MENKIYAFVYSSCIYESSAETISLHKTKDGAEIAMIEHREKQKEEHEELGLHEHFRFDEDKYWGVKEMELLD